MTFKSINKSLDKKNKAIKLKLKFNSFTYYLNFFKKFSILDNPILISSNDVAYDNLI